MHGLRIGDAMAELTRAKKQKTTRSGRCARLHSLVSVVSAMRTDCLRARLRVQEKLAHLVDFFKLDFFPTHKTSEYGRWGEELQRVTVAAGQ